MVKVDDVRVNEEKGFQGLGGNNRVKPVVVRLQIPFFVLCTCVYTYTYVYVYVWTDSFS